LTVSIKHFTFTTCLFSDIDQIKDGMAEKVSITLQYLSLCISGLVVAFVYSWKLALVTLSVSPLLMISNGIMMKVGEIDDILGMPARCL